MQSIKNYITKYLTRLKQISVKGSTSRRFWLAAIYYTIKCKDDMYTYTNSCSNPQIPFPPLNGNSSCALNFKTAKKKNDNNNNLLF